MLKQITQTTLDQLMIILSQMEDDQYQRKLNVLNESSIGMHVRHVLEFYICLKEGIILQEVNYDHRKRDLQLEISVQQALLKIGELKDYFCKDDDFDPIFRHDIVFNGEVIPSHSSLSRELVYLIEHSIHHYAIINIALRNDFREIVIPQNFGVAYSTVSHHEQRLGHKASTISQ